MIKTCTNSRCRRPFDTALDTYRGWGPYCRKGYPRLPKAERFSLRGKPERLYGVILRSFGQNKIMAIKIVCKYRSIGLAEAKELVESAPVTIGHLHSRDTALRFADELKAIGCVADTCKIKWLVRGEIIGIDLGSGSIPEPI